MASTALLTFYRVCAKRGSLLANVAGIVVHDHWKPYYTMQGVLHALCNAHHLRELKALVEIEKEEWAGKMQRLLRRACHAGNRKRELAVNDLYAALSDGSLLAPVRDPASGQMFQLTASDWRGAVFWRDIIVSGVVRSPACEEIERHRTASVDR